ncbi:MAG: Gfo/Idh/MocA family oxidoreductase [Gammaproteobacteria bacterium]|nr:Gfo/Idh/MocA family oxidoreductase [Gammaproteobacteria bacterium]
MRKLRFGMVGGGEGAFIGQVHRMAAELDGLAQLVCGAFSADAAKSTRSGQQIYHLPIERCYANYLDMFVAEAARADGMQFVVIATPNHTHFEIAQAALHAGLHVVCDKPVTLSLQQALDLQKIVGAEQAKFALTHNYTGYPMIKEARELVRSGAIGRVRRVSCEYLQGWLATDMTDNKQAGWRTDPDKAGLAGCFGDIGSHADNLIRYVTELPIESLCADLSTFVEGRKLDDDGNVLLRFCGGARGVISASQIAAGKENDLKLQVYGERGGLEWCQTQANSLLVRWLDKPYEVRRTGGPGISDAAQNASRIPAGHPEGYLEAFAQIYRQFCLDLLGAGGGDYPTINDGVRGLQFIEQVVASSQQGAVWVTLENLEKEVTQ